METAAPAGAPALFGVMGAMPGDAIRTGLASLLRGEPRADRLVLLSRLEELSTLVLEGVVTEDLLRSTLPIDRYWAEVGGEVIEVRRRSGNRTFSENFERAALLATQCRDREPAGGVGSC